MDNPMASENSFRVALAMVIVLTTLITGFHRFKAAQSDEKISRREEGYVFAVVLRLAGLMLFVITIAYLLAPSSVRWAMFAIPIAIRWMGAVTGLFSSVLMLAIESYVPAHSLYDFSTLMITN